MKKQKITLIVVLVLLVVLIGALIGVNKYNKDQEDKEAEEEAGSVVFEIEQDDIYSFSMTDSNDQVLSFHLEDDQWIYDDYPDVDIDEDTVSSILENLTKITTTSVITEGDASEYGFDTPSYEYTVSDAAGNTTTISFGMQNPVTSDYYFVLNNDYSAIYVNDGSLISISDNSIDSLVVESDDETESTEETTESETVTEADTEEDVESDAETDTESETETESDSNN